MSRYDGESKMKDMASINFLFSRLIKYRDKKKVPNARVIAPRPTGPSVSKLAVFIYIPGTRDRFFMHMVYKKHSRSVSKNENDFDNR